MTQKNKGAVTVGQVGLIILAMAIVAGGAYYLGRTSPLKEEVKNQEVSQDQDKDVKEIENKKVEVEDTACQGMGCNNNSDEKNPGVLAVDSNLIKLNACGVSLSKASTWSVISNTNSEIKLNLLPENHSDFSGIHIKCVLSSSITDTDAKFGNITYYYDSITKKWMVNSPNERDGGTFAATEAVPLFTVNGFSVFQGTGRWLTYIVPISPSSILYLKEGDAEGGHTQTLTDLVKTLKKL